MTAIAIVTFGAGVVVASDGGNYLADGTLDGIAGKVVILPEASAVVTGRGSCLAHAIALQDTAMATERLSLDRLVELAPEHVDKVARAIRAATGEAAPMFSVYIAGWSEAAETAESWGIYSYDTPHAPARVVHRLPECFVTPDITGRVADHFGLRMPSSGETQWREDPEAFAVRAVCAARFAPCAHPSDPAKQTPRGAAGGFVQKTIVTRRTVLSQIVHEWPDVIGEPIVPTRGVPFPGARWTEEVPQ